MSRLAVVRQHAPWDRSGDERASTAGTHAGPELRVFISSTLAELAQVRLAARDATDELRLTPVFFEHGARPHPPEPLYRAYLEQSQIFVGNEAPLRRQRD